MESEKDLDFETWNVNYFIEAAPLAQYLNSLTVLIGKKINDILTMGCIFNLDDILAGGNRALSLDEPVVIMIGDTGFNVWFYTDSRVKIGINALTLKESSYQGCDWHNCNDLFPNGIIGQKVVRFEVEKSNEGFHDSLGLRERPDGGDYFISFKIILENGRYLEIGGGNEYMFVAD